ncbi:Lrp/AsnC family transcriptional regulator [Acidimangrovimonas sediminis]|uniref:Lrp/AsnC family transcriptional regulator n=1 Tax=Acidimangrovimonas sediminis TaxID=2056283 RepID=UPI000C801260|nr:Lrp/AsnC family transcriptional regulator [Acidimangrovimonas sediminis]
MPQQERGFDAATLRILDALQENAALSNAELAERVNLSASPCWRRVAELRESGVIRGSVALADPISLGLSVNVFVQVTLVQQDKASLKVFTDAIEAREEVMECYLMTGEADFMLRIVVEDLQRYQELVLEFLTQIPGVANIRSSFALDQVKYTTALPTSHLGKAGRRR